MNKYLFYAMRGEKMCFVHTLLNALALEQAGNTVKIVFEGEAVKLPPVLALEKNPLYEQVLQKGMVSGVCKACATMMKVEEDVRKLGLPLLDDMSGHAGILPFIEQGYQVFVF